MTNRLWPADAVGGAPAYSGRALRQTQAPFLAGATSGRPLGARSGVRPGTASTTVGASPTLWSCAPHAGVLDVQTAAEAGPYTYAIDTTVSGAMVASNASNPRTDIVYVQVTDAAEDGAAPGQAPVVTVGYLAGTASATAPAPATPVRSIVLARINVPKTGGGNPTVTWVAPYAVAAGGTLPIDTLENLKLIRSTSLRQRAEVFADSPENNGTYVWTGSDWASTAKSRFRVRTAPVLEGNVVQPVPPADAVIYRQYDALTVGTNASGQAALTFPEAFPNGILHVNVTVLGGSPRNPVVNSGQISKSRAVLIWTSDPNAAIRVSYEAVGW